ncbi:glycosyltransferase [Photobacterium sp. TY1-4]|uniref:glycosyltransferase n=1 Tax=Photobacterium sp. TY1-4 TaxID=2899122 RepID=UPI0021C16CC3|nr:glycosyltransferase [Photobacterium sp. TY1-4]UXI00542.1 glycosyltransferase [Photobacterium sp. TY1-4]
MKKILVVTESFNIGGVETYISTQARVLKENGCRIHLAAGENFNQSLDFSDFDTIDYNLKLNYDTTLSELNRTISELRKIIKKYEIDIVHTHPFHSILPAVIAAKIENIPVMLTLHGPVSIEGFFGPEYDFVLNDLISKYVDLTLAVSEEVYALAQLHFKNIHLLRNSVLPVNNEVNQKLIRLNHYRCLVVSRLDADKLPGIIEFLKFAIASEEIKYIDIAGDGDSSQIIKDFVDENKCSERVRLLGFVDSISQNLSHYDLIAGMGRCVIEAAIAKKIVCLVGYDGVKGFLNDVRFTKAKKCNFSGRNLKKINYDVFFQQLKNATVISESLLKEFDAYNLWVNNLNLSDVKISNDQSFFDNFSNLIEYTSYNSDNTEPYLHSPEFRKIIETLTFSFPFESLKVIASYEQKFLSNNQLSEIHAGLLKELHYFSEKNKHETISINDNLLKLNEKINFLENIIESNHKELDSSRRTIFETINSFFKESKSRMTDFFMSVKKSKFSIVMLKRHLYQMARTSFWLMPSGLRHKLNGIRFKVVRRFRGQAVVAPLNEVNKFDLNWDSFKENILSKKDDYKGIFVQEVVIDWDVPLYQRPQHIACAFGRAGYLVIYRTTNLTHDCVNGFREVAPNVWLTNSPQVDHIKGAVRSFYSTAYSLPPQQISKLSNYSTIMYEYIDHIDPAISGDDENIKRLLELKQASFNGGADVVVASAKKLESEALEFVDKDKVILAQNGVDTCHYRDPVHVECELPTELVNFRNKYEYIVGYFGAIAPWLWYEEIEKLVLSRPDLGFVFIGPDYYGGVDKLVKADNVLYLGTVDYKVLPGYAHTFDICFIPFAPTEIARTTSPLKLFEYFALEKPVVVTSEMLECIAFDEVLSGDSAESLSKQIDKAIELSKDSEFKNRLASLADENSWDARVAEMEKSFAY